MRRSGAPTRADGDGRRCSPLESAPIVVKEKQLVISNDRRGWSRTRASSCRVVCAEIVERTKRLHDDDDDTQP